MIWNERNTSALRQMWDTGNLSAGQIANKLNTTRNSVIGKVYRLKLTNRNPSLSLEARMAISRGRRATKKPVSKTKPRTVGTPLKEKRDAIWDSKCKPRSLAKSINHKTCQYPIGEICLTDEWKCGAATYRNSYCEEHYARTHS